MLCPTYFSYIEVSRTLFSKLVGDVVVQHDGECRGRVMSRDVACRGSARRGPRVPCTNTVGGSPRTNQRNRTCAHRTPGGNACRAASSAAYALAVQDLAFVLYICILEASRKELSADIMVSFVRLRYHII